VSGSVGIRSCDGRVPCGTRGRNQLRMLARSVEFAAADSQADMMDVHALDRPVTHGCVEDQVSLVGDDRAVAPGGYAGEAARERGFDVVEAKWPAGAFRGADVEGVHATPGGCSARQPAGRGDRGTYPQTARERPHAQVFTCVDLDVSALLESHPGTLALVRTGIYDIPKWYCNL